MCENVPKSRMTNSPRENSEAFVEATQWAGQNSPDGYTLLRGEGCHGGASEDSVLANQEYALRDQLGRLKGE